jgi:hypothetical protein
MAEEINQGRPSSCKHFTTQLCPHRRNEVLSECENLVGEVYKGYSKIHTHEVFEKGEKVCAECKSFEPRERR